jgi:hypothetical protein
MALKGGRKIMVGSRYFRWAFKAHKDDQTRLGGSPRRGHIAVQEDVDGRSGRPMVAWVESHVWDDTPDAHQPRWGGTLHKASVTPGDIRFLVELCISQGWDPSSREKQFDCPPGAILSNYVTHEKDQ